MTVCENVESGWFVSSAILEAFIRLANNLMSNISTNKLILAVIPKSSPSQRLKINIMLQTGWMTCPKITTKKHEWIIIQQASSVGSRWGYVLKSSIFFPEYICDGNFGGF